MGTKRGGALYGQPANQVARKLKMSCTVAAPELSKSAGQQGFGAETGTGVQLTPAPRNRPGGPTMTQPGEVVIVQAAPRQHAPVMITEQRLDAHVSVPVSDTPPIVAQSA